MNKSAKLALTILAMYGLLIGVCAFASVCKSYNKSNRDLKYEHYCDSIYENNYDEYIDILVETDEFQEYVEKHGEWWNN